MRGEDRVLFSRGLLFCRFEVFDEFVVELVVEEMEGEGEAWFLIWVVVCW